MNSKRKKTSTHSLDDPVNAPMVEIFGGAFALLLILFILVNVIANTEIYAMLDSTSDERSYKISWENETEGFVVMVFPDRVQILQTGQSVPRSQICAPGGAFLQYANRLYDARPIQQMVFAIVEGAVDTMALARNCLHSNYLGRRISIGWIIANHDLLQAVRLEDIPAEIKRAVSGSADQ